MKNAELKFKVITSHIKQSFHIVQSSQVHWKYEIIREIEILLDKIGQSNFSR
jgi:hypothetical protein